MNEEPVIIKEEELQEVQREPTNDVLDYIIYFLKNRKKVLWILLFVFGGGLVEENISSNEHSKEISISVDATELIRQIEIIRHQFSETESSEVNEASLLILKLYIEGKITETECQRLLQIANSPTPLKEEPLEEQP